MMMFEKETTDLLLKFLEKKAKDAEKQIEKTGTISDEMAIPILLKTQFNHIYHLDLELSALRGKIEGMVTKDEFREFKKDINNRLTWTMSLTAILICFVLPIILKITGS